MNEYQLRRWAIDAAISAGAKEWQVEGLATQFVLFVLGEDIVDKAAEQDEAQAASFGYSCEGGDLSV